MAWDDRPNDLTPPPVKGAAPVKSEPDQCTRCGAVLAINCTIPRCPNVPPLKAPGLTPYDITRDWQAEHGGSWADVSRHLWGD